MARKLRAVIGTDMLRYSLDDEQVGQDIDQQGLGKGRSLAQDRQLGPRLEHRVGQPGECIGERSLLALERSRKI